MHAFVGRLVGSLGQRFSCAAGEFGGAQYYPPQVRQTVRVDLSEVIDMRVRSEVKVAQTGPACSAEVVEMLQHTVGQVGVERHSGGCLKDFGAGGQLADSAGGSA
ncbi:hypothetical protein SAMN05216268_103219 [Streptomyces yunnanensis]|uniref:Uncharacterized protein n=1 Tax=Streptomyces yunnanensis TaxID=156453 RepID=A0A9X8QQ16_9ACTN|nr:hypothetical protein SAMN05216268_103219 [Streptomyces yunnanensis]